MAQWKIHYRIGQMEMVEAERLFVDDGKFQLANWRGHRHLKWATVFAGTTYDVISVTQIPSVNESHIRAQRRLISPLGWSVLVLGPAVMLAILALCH